MATITREKPKVSAVPSASRRRQQVTGSLREMILAMSPGERLPSVAALAQQFGVAVGTLKLTLETLRCEGLIVSRPRSGTYVAARVPDAADPARSAAEVSQRIGSITLFALCSNPFFENCVFKLVQEGSRRGLSVECQYMGGNLTLDDALRSEPPHSGGIVVIGMGLEWLAAALKERDHRVVLIGDPEANAVPAVPTVFVDAEYAGYLATRRILSLGHRRILYLHQAPDLPALRRRRRWHGHERAMRDAEVAEPWLTARYGDIKEQFSTPEKIRAYFTGPDAPTAVVCWYDGLALELMNSLRQAGISVPEDVSVIGYDNLPLGEHTWPPLDTVDLHMDDQVSYALDLLSLPTGRRAATSATLITPTLITRASCGPPFIAV